MEYIIVFMFGAIIGSFLNVCIYRIPIGKSIVKPRSFCPFCRRPIPWYDNVPLISYMILRAKCRSCTTPIPARYFLVELLTALASVGMFMVYGLTGSFFMYWALVCALIAVIFIDIEHQEIPDVISLPGIIAGLILFTAVKADGSGSHIASFANSGLGMLAGGGSMFILGMLGELVFKKEALGGGDVKLMAMLGAFLGWKLILLTFFLSPFFGSFAGIIMKVKYKKEVVPYGPFLSVAAIISLIWGEDILRSLFAF